MALFRLPLSGDVVQWINPITWFMSGNQITANVYLGESSAPEVETEILDRIGTYGRQLGQISDAMIVLLKYLPDRSNLSAQETEAIDAFEKMAGAIADIKNKHKRQACDHERASAARMREATSGILVHPRISQSSCGHLAKKDRPSTLETHQADAPH